MYFNLDRATKNKLLQEYKQNMIDYRLQKDEARRKRIQEEREYLYLKEQRQEETDKRIKEENLRKKNELMGEYQQMLEKTKLAIPGYHFRPKNTEVVINNWGMDKNAPQPMAYTPSYNNKSQSIDVNDPINRQRNYFRQRDSMNKFLTDEQNLNEVNSYFKEQKINRQNYYKDLLYNQHLEAINKNRDMYGTEDYLILKQKKKSFLSSNPYNSNHKYDFGNSSIINNPILNPGNNFYYNKYFKNFYQELQQPSYNQARDMKKYAINYNPVNAAGEKIIKGDGINVIEKNKNYNTIDIENSNFQNNSMTGEYQPRFLNQSRRCMSQQYIRADNVDK